MKWLNGFCWTHNVNYNLYEGPNCPACILEGVATPHPIFGTAGNTTTVIKELLKDDPEAFDRETQGSGE